MVMFKIIVVSFIIFVLSHAEKIQYISTEHPAVTYVNTKYVKYANISANRYSRRDPFYYVHIDLLTYVPFHNNVSMHFFFYELLTNVYKRSFVEMHFKLCDLIHKDNFFGSAMRQGKLTQPCPYPPGRYDLHNMTIPIKIIPKNFPFRRGRIYANVTKTKDYENGLIVSGYIDMEIKEAHI